MTGVIQILPYELQNVARNRWIIVYALLFLGITEILFHLGDGGQVMLSLMNLVIILIPLMSITFGVIYLYGSREYIEMMLAQPIRRETLFLGLYAGLTVPLAAGFVLGVSIPLVYNYPLLPDGYAAVTLLTSGVFLTAIFVAIAFVIALRFDDRLRGFGVALVVWLAFAVLYDAIVLLTVVFLNNFPLEKPLIVLTALNPLDLARIMFLMEMDIAALMGYTGAVFHRFFGSLMGTSISLILLVAWFYLPFRLASRRFLRKDF